MWLQGERGGGGGGREERWRNTGGVRERERERVEINVDVQVGCIGDRESTTHTYCMYTVHLHVY